MDGGMKSLARMVLLMATWPLVVFSWLAKQLQWLVRVHASLTCRRHVSLSTVTTHQLKDGRALAYHVYGDLRAKHAIFWLHGLVSSRLEVMAKVHH